MWKKAIICTMMMVMGMSVLACGESKEEIVLVVEKIEDESEQDISDQQKENTNQSPEILHNTVDQQLQVILNQKSLWEDTGNVELYCYAVTDLNHNGRLELVSSSCQGTGMYTYSQIWEVNESLNDLAQYTYDITEEESQADIGIENVTTYVDETKDIYYYIFDDYMRVGAAENYNSKQAIYLEDDLISTIFLGTKHETYDIETDKAVVTFNDAGGDEITEEQYESSEKEMFGHLVKKQTTIQWAFSDVDEWKNDMAGTLRKSWEAFAMK